MTDEEIADPDDGPPVPRALDVAEGSGGSRAAARVAREREDAQAFEGREPLRRRVLEALAETAATPRALAGFVGAANESVSRVMGSLQKDGLVQAGAVEGDKRLRLYSLTREGEIRLNKLRTFGVPQDPATPPTSEETLSFLYTALRNAVRMRRESNSLKDAGDRLRVIVEEAQRLGLHELELEAMAELATTLRQERQMDALDALLDTLQEMALGRHPNRNPALVLPAAAHREYALGRLPEMHGGGDPCVKARHLDAAQSLFGQLARSADSSDTAAWKVREAWSVISLANNLRERSKLEEALEKTDWAISLFDDLQDPYGRSRCLFMFGFCQRLIGDFDDAWLRLGEAHDLAKANSFQRFEADSLMQMGDVRRCQGDAGGARALLEEAFARSERMGLVVTQAFAQSALGAVAFEESRLTEAQASLRLADGLFEACGHSEGHALNDRRRAIVERHLETEGRRSEFGVARRFALKALERYQQLQSPAGMVACEIEAGRQEMMGGGRVDRQFARLIERLDDTHQLDLIERDPWVPKVLHRFAEEAGNAALGERAQQLVAASERRLAYWASQSAGRVVERVSEVRQKLQHTDAFPFEMGGEARREEDAVCQTQVAG